MSLCYCNQKVKALKEVSGITWAVCHCRGHYENRIKRNVSLMRNSKENGTLVLTEDV